MGCQKQKSSSEDSNRSGEFGTVRLKSNTQEQAQTEAWSVLQVTEEDEFLHSEDMDNNPSQPSNPMIAARPEAELEPIRKCIDQDDLKTLNEKYFGTFPGNDHQLNHAFEVIGCVPN